jgi:protein-tyrosine phosphatase
MIDLHCHILPGLDDGPADIDATIALARSAAAAGTEVVAATPHIREDFPFPYELVDQGVAEVNRTLSEARIPLTVVAGGEVAIDKAADIDDVTLRRLCLGDGSYLLVESPYGDATDLLENTLFDLQVRGFRPLLAHPERSPSFLGNLDRLKRLVDRGILCSVTAASMAGTFGSTVRGYTAELFGEGLVHDVASDAHSATKRAPGLLGGFEQLEGDLPGLTAQAGWFTDSAPRAILAGADLPARPDPPAAKRRGIRGLLRR